MLHVLLCEDDEVDAMYAKRLFGKSDRYVYHRVENGQQGLDFLLNTWSPSDPIVVVTDINMPLLDGVSLLKSIRSNEKTAHIPVFILTISDMDENIEEAYKYAVNGYLLKPIDLLEFERLIGNVV